MINPGVIQLATLKHTNYRFDIEDNIGESIHIHYMDMRFDFTIKEFIEFANDVEKIVNLLLSDIGESLQSFDLAFFIDLAGSIPDLERVTYERLMLDELQVDTHNEEGAVVVRPLKESRVLKALNGMTSENDRREQKNYFSPLSCSLLTNQERLDFNLERMKRQDGFAPNDFITLYNDSNIIRDGQHSAACLYYLKGNTTVPIRRLWFRDDKYDFIPNRENIGYFGSLFFDTGNGFSEDEKTTFETDDVIFGKKFMLPKQTTSVRYDPLEDVFCSISNFEATNSMGVVKIKNTDFDIQSDTFIFHTFDPQIILDIEKDAEPWIELKASIKRITLGEITELFWCMKHEQNILINERNFLYGERDNLYNERNELYSLRDILTNERNALINDLNTLISSTSWKITKPLRGIVRFIKKCIKKH